MYRTVICATLVALSGCASVPGEDDEFARGDEPPSEHAALTALPADSVPQAADASASGGDLTQSDGDCDVVLSIDVRKPAATTESERGLSFIALGADEETTELRIWAQNRSPQVQRFRYFSPGCPAPALLLGLPEGYDAYGVCGLPACDREGGGAQVVVRPGQRVSLGRAQVSSAPSACNARGLGPGLYLLTATLGEVDGARVCVRAPFALAVLDPGR